MVIREIKRQTIDRILISESRLLKLVRNELKKIKTDKFRSLLFETPNKWKSPAHGRQLSLLRPLLDNGNYKDAFFLMASQRQTKKTRREEKVSKTKTEKEEEEEKTEKKRTIYIYIICSQFFSSPFLSSLVPFNRQYRLGWLLFSNSQLPHTMSL